MHDSLAPGSSPRGLGEGGSIAAAQAEVVPAIRGRFVEYEREGLSEWYVAHEEGLEQGFTIDTPPSGRGPLILRLSIEGFAIEILPGRRSACFTEIRGGTVLSYTGLKAWDATGKELETRLDNEDGSLLIVVEDEDAAYPVLIDPLISVEQAKLVPSDPATGDVFGCSVSVSGKTAVVGAWGDDPFGSAYVFVHSNQHWAEQAKLVPNDPYVNVFGVASNSDDTALIGDHLNDEAGTNAGAAYVFVRNGSAWSQQAKLMASDATPSDHFGVSVAISGDTAAVGSYWDDNAGGIAAGSIYVFVRNGTTWSEQARLEASDGEAGDQLGFSVAISGDTIVAGANFGNEPGGGQSGAAYVFVRNGVTWTQQAKLNAIDAQAGDLFGRSVGVSGDSAIVGATGDVHTPGAPGSPSLSIGSAYIFSRNGTGWSQQAWLTSSEPASGDLFGDCVAVSGDLAVVGAPGDDELGFETGAAFAFRRSEDTWNEQEKVTASDPGVNLNFGNSVSIFGDIALIGAFKENQYSGAAYVFRISQVPVENYCTAGTSASGCNALLSANGTPSATAPTGFVLTATTVEGSKDGIYFYSSNGRQANSWGNGTSFQCVVPPVHRGGLLVGSGANGACDGSFSQDLNALWCPTCPKPNHNPGVGAVVQAQLWYRDPLNTSNQTTSLSDAIEFLVAP